MIRTDNDIPTQIIIIDLKSALDTIDDSIILLRLTLLNITENASLNNFIKLTYNIKLQTESQNKLIQYVVPIVYYFKYSRKPIHAISIIWYFIWYSISPCTLYSVQSTNYLGITLTANFTITIYINYRTQLGIMNLISLYKIRNH